MREPGAVAQYLPDRDPLLACGGELGPVVRDGSVDVDLAALHEHVCADRGRALRGREDDGQRVRRPLSPTGEIGQAAPDVDHRLPVEVDRAGGTDVATLLEILDERADDRFEARLRPTSDLDLLGARRARVRVHGPVSLGTSLVGFRCDRGPRARRPGALLRRDPRLPEERRRFRQGDGLAAGRRPRPGVLGRGRRAGGRQHVRLRRGRPPGVHRRDARSRRGAQAGRQAGGHGLPRRALRRRARHGAARGGRRRRLRRRRRSRRGGPEAQAGRRARPARAAAPHPGRSLGVRQGGRGM